MKAGVLAFVRCARSVMALSYKASAVSGDVETSLSCDPLKSWRKCVLLVHARWRNSVLHRRLMYKAEKARGRRFAGPPLVTCKWSGGDAGLVRVRSCCEQLRGLLVFMNRARVHLLCKCFTGRLTRGRDERMRHFLETWSNIPIIFP